VTIISKATAADVDSYSAFGGTDLADRLSAMNTRRLWIAGLALDYCVRETARDARRLGYEVHVIAEATRAVNVHPDDGAARWKSSKRWVRLLKAATVRVVAQLEESARRENSPPWTRRGGRDLKKNVAKQPCWERTGWFVQLPIIGGLNQPPRLREQLWLREVFLIAQPPLLVQGGELPVLSL
jgi:hypothetical protein